MIVLITVLILVFVVQTSLDRQLSAINWDNQQAQNVAQMGFDTALSRIRQTLAPFDDPFGSTNAVTNFWSLSPGRIDLFALTNGHHRPLRVDIVPLHSGYPIANTKTPAADLNAPDGFGHRPIWSEDRKMEVEWLPVGENPAEALSPDNPLIGRYAFWVDDEGSKINVNTADGSDNYTLSSYGQGTPTAVSLSVFRELTPSDTNAPDPQTVRLIAAEARRTPLAAISEMAMRATLSNSVSPKFSATHVFNLTTYSRSPDFNIFNLPKFQLIPSNVDSLNQLAGAANFIPINRMVQYDTLGDFYGTGALAAQSALRSLYPTPSQLSPVWRKIWPLMPSYSLASGDYGQVNSKSYRLITSLEKRKAAGGNFPYEDQTNRFSAMVQMERYLTEVSMREVNGKMRPYADPGQLPVDPLGSQIRWPFESGTYATKYNLRQLDSITLQIFEMPRMEDGNTRMVAPGIVPYGILGDQPVQSAVGHYPRLVRVAGTFATQERPTKDLDKDGSWNDYDGANVYSRLTFWVYVPKNLYSSDNYVDSRFIHRTEWNSPQQGPYGMANISWGEKKSALNERDTIIISQRGRSLLNPNSAWADTLFYAEAWNPGTGKFEGGNSAGIDFAGNPNGSPDPDKVPDSEEPGELRVEHIRYDPLHATGWHDKEATPVLINNVFGSNPTGPERYAERGIYQNFETGNFWGAFGQTRNIGDKFGDRIQKLRLKGGVTLRMNQFGMVAGVTPIDSISGPLDAAGQTTGEASVTNAWVPLFGQWRENGNFGAEVSILNPLSSAAKFRLLAYVAFPRDPLVNQLPGDWINRSAGLSQIVFNPFDVPASIVKTLSGHPSPLYNVTNIEFNYHEPEWVDRAAEFGAAGVLTGVSGNQLLRPTWNGSQKLVPVAAATGGWEVVNLPLQQAFPSVGHLQYVRTGVMPDNENAKIGDADYAGMPFRCLNFGPANTQGQIPDWALLDLFTVPNAIWTLPASRFAYPAISVNQNDRPQLIQLTYGGASTGKINLNGSVLWPWAEDEPEYVRTLPLAAQFNGLRYNQNGVVRRNTSQLINNDPNWPTVKRARIFTETNSWKVLSASNAHALAGDIAAYIRQQGPLSMPGQVCDIAAVNFYGAQIPTTLKGSSILPPRANGSLRDPASDDFYTQSVPSGGTNQTRNDIVSQSIGNLVTQGNVFAVWVVGESIRKSKTSDPALYEEEKGDRVVAQTRLRFLVERKLDPGVDDVYGNSAPGRSGLDGIIGTPDDLYDPNNSDDGRNHPDKPKFIYQVINVQQIQ